MGQGRTLLQATLDRLAPIASETFVVTGQRHADAVRAQLPGTPAENVIAEPSPRDSMAAIALAAAIIEQRRGPCIMGSFAADHVIRDADGFRSAVMTAIAAARDGAVATIGIEPTAASSAFGYIEAGPAQALAGVFGVEAFTEKPDPETAQQFLDRGGYYWNAGMFVVATQVLLAHLERLQPTLHSGVRAIAEAWDTPARAATLDEVWPHLTRIAIDHAIAEPVAAEGGVSVVPASFGWADIGDFASLSDLTDADQDGLTTVGRTAPVTIIDAERAMVVGGDRRVAIVGLDDVVVVDTPEAILVLHRDRAQDVKTAAERAADA